MRLVESHIRGFGCLVDRRLQFASQVQVIVGSNEAGKSTLQQFLLAMLFGLKREGRKRRDYLPQYERYRPWNAAVYEGSLRYELSSGEQWEVQRVFEREGESLRLFDALTGEERTELYAMDSRKERNFMLEQLHLTRQLFEATTSLGQLSGQPSEEGVGAFRERIQGILDSGDEAVSARSALGSLQNLRDSFGTGRTPSRGLGLLKVRKQDLEDELQAAQLRHTEILELYTRRNQSIISHQRAEESWRRARNAELSHQRDLLQKRLWRAEKLEQQLEESRQLLASYDDVAALNISDYNVAREESTAITARQSELQPRIEALEALRSRLQELQASEVELASTLGDMQRADREKLEREANRLREAMGRVREARRRNLEEQNANKEAVERLARHHGKDWTDEEFMARLASEAPARDASRAQPLQQALVLAQRSYMGARRHFLLGALIALVVILGVTALMLWSPGSLPVAVRVGIPALLLLLVVALIPNGLRQFLAKRDQVRAMQSQLQNVLEHVQEARVWVKDVLERNGVAAVEDLQQAHREYVALSASAGRSLESASLQERVESEEALRLEAQQLRDAVGGCDFARLRDLLERQAMPAHDLLPYAEDESTHMAQEDSTELSRLADDLRLLPELRRGFSWLDRLQEERLRLERNQGQLQTEHDRRQEAIQQARQRLQEQLAQQGVADMQAFAALAQRLLLRQKLVGEHAPLQSEQSGVLGGETLAALRGRVEALDLEIRHVEQEEGAQAQATLDWSDATAPVEFASTAPQPVSLEDLGREVERLAAERAQLEERLTAREREGRTLAEIQLSLDEVGLEMAMEERRDQALMLAMETLQQVTAKLHREIAPQMNARVGSFFSRLSLGKHQEVHLDESLTPRIRTAEGVYCEVESLSGGAADQLYFALRVTAGEQLARSGERLPLLLDDPFVQYDPQRMAAALELVTELARDHQIFFFTCEDQQATELQRRAENMGLDTGMLRL